jgi:hypothetical protein
VPEQIDIALAEDLKQFYADPLGFVMWAYPWGQPGPLEKHDGPDQWQKDVLNDIGRQVRERNFDGVTPVSPIRIVIVSGHGVGKTTLFAWLTHWILSTRPRCRGTVTANTFSQLSTKTWAAIQTWALRLINRHWFVITSTSIYYRDMKQSWAFSTQSCGEENSEAFAGQHAADSTSAYLFDEASAVPDKIFEVSEGGLSDGEPMIIVAGNPTRSTGKFHRITFGSERDRWTRFSVDSRTSKFANKELIKQWAEDYGEDSDFFRVRVRGECPRAGTTQLISQDVVAACRKFKATGYETLPKILSCDPARFGDDRSVIGMRQGRKFEVLAKYRGIDLVQLTERFVQFINSKHPDGWVIDGDGLGAGVVDMLRAWNHGTKLHEYHGGGRPIDVNAHFNRRAECWCKMRDWLIAGAEIPDDPEIEIDLCGTQYGFSSKSAIQLEKKEDLKARGLASPDIGDTLAMTFAFNIAKKSTYIQPEINPFFGHPDYWMTQ